MIHLAYGNRLEALAELLARDLAGRSDPLEPTVVLVGGRVLDWWARLAVAATNGIAAHIVAQGLHAFLAERVRASGCGILVDRPRLETTLLLWLTDPRNLDHVAYQPLRHYLDAAGEEPGARDRRCARLAWELASLYMSYALEGPDTLARWGRDEQEDEPEQERGDSLEAATSPVHGRWQRRLWRALVGENGPLGPEAREPSSGLPYVTWSSLLHPELLERLAPPTPIHWLAPAALWPAEERVVTALAHTGTLKVYALNPSREFWEDAPARKRRPRNTRQLALPLGGGTSGASDLLAPAGGADDEPRALTLWGSEARRRVRFFSQLAEGDFADAFKMPPDISTRLGVMQASWLRRAAHVPEGWRAKDHDGSLVVLGCPSRRRTAEAVAADIWRRVLGADARAPLGFQEIAVFAAGPDPDAWLGLLAAAFEEARELPTALVERALGTESPFVEGVELLLGLPAGRLSRREVLRALCHPTLRRHLGLGAPDEVNALALHLGVVRERDEDDGRDETRNEPGLAQEPRPEDPAAWENGLLRLALGRVVEPNGGEGELAPPVPVSPSWQERADALALTLRALLSDAATLRRARLGLGAWAEAFRRLIDTYCGVHEPGDETARLRLYDLLANWSALAPTDAPVSFQAAYELFRLQSARLTSGRGTPLTSAITVAPLGSARQVPYRVIYVVGLNEADFPSSAGRHHLDARPAEETARLLSPRDRELGLFLDTFLAAREAVVLAYQDRDEKTGEVLRPSPVLEELEGVALALGCQAETSELVHRVPLWRHEDPACRVAFPAAAREHAARTAPGASIGPGDIAAAPAASAPPSPSPLPRQAPSLAVTTKRLRVTHLRDFLRCPLQGSAKAVLGLRETEDESEETHREDDVLDPARLARTQLLRRVFWSTWFEAGGGHAEDRGGLVSAPPSWLTDERLLSTYDRHLAELSRSGHYPAGLFATARRAPDLATLTSWAQGLALVTPAVRGPLPSWRMGRGMLELRTESRPPLRWDLALAEPTTVELHGTLLPRVAVGGLQAVGAGPVARELAVQLLAGSLKKSSHFPPAKELRVFEALFQHVVRAAASDEGAGPAGVVLVGDDPEPAPLVVRFKELAATEARAYLTTLSTDLLAESHAYLFPYDAVLEWRPLTAKRREAPAEASGDARDEVGTALAATMEKLFRDPYYRSRLSSQHGPVRRWDEAPLPTAAEAARIWQRRFAPLWALVDVEDEP